MFCELVNDIATQINANGEYAVEFASDGVFMLAFLRFWRQDELLLHYALPCGFIGRKSGAGLGAALARIIKGMLILILLFLKL